VKHLLVTNDFPPKIGGIQSYLWELWRRLPPDEVAVLTTPYEGAAGWDRTQPFLTERTEQSVLLPTPGLVRRIDRLAAETSAELVLLDPALPLGLVGPRLSGPFGLVLHGAEVTVPGRVPGASTVLGRVLRQARLVVAAGGYPAAEAERVAGRSLPVVVVPPGVDADRFQPLNGAARVGARVGLGLPPDRRIVLGVSRLVPRKGFDVLIEAAGLLAADHPDLMVVIAGDGRDRQRLERMAASNQAPVRFLGRVPDDRLPAVYGAADVFAMLCRNRWGGLEQEGFGIVFLEAAAAGVPQVAGASGGADEAVVDGETGLVVRHPEDPLAAAGALDRLLDDVDLRERMGRNGRMRVEAEFSYEVLAARLREALALSNTRGPPAPFAARRSARDRMSALWPTRRPSG
jgi:phosphatidyl-myo-inositol dimannoside synthase